MSGDICTSCRKRIQPFDGVHVLIREAYQLFCTKCYNDMTAEYLGIDFDHASFNPITLKDKDGIDHIFHFRTRLLGDRVIIDGIEIFDEYKQGYEFAVIGDSEEDLLNLFKLLFERIRRALSQKHIESDDRNQYSITGQDTVRGYFTSSINSVSKGPLLIIDGKEVLWDEFGRMLRTFEGFNFKLEIYDKTEEK